MKKTSLSLLFAFCVTGLFCSCEGMRPNDNLETVLSGDVFGGGKKMDPMTAREQEDAAREDYRVSPRRYSVDKETETSENGRLGLTMNL